MKPEFYKMDFRAWNVGTVDLSLEQEAAYLRLCHAMYDARGPVPESTRLLQGLFRCGNVKAAALVQQLVAAGKIRRTEDGKLTNPRVTTELAGREALSDVRREAGGNGGRARRVTAECGASGAEVNGQCAPSEGEVNPECPASEGEVIPAKPLENIEAGKAIAPTQISRGEEKRGEKTPVAPKGAEPEGFAEFRVSYPRRSTAFPVTDARKRWMEARRRGTAPGEIIAGARAYAAEQDRLGKIGTEFVQSANVWLNKQRWKDYQPQDLPLALGGSAAGSSYLASLSDDRWRAEVRRWRNTVGAWDLAAHTPPPDAPATKVPAHILREFNVQPRPANPPQEHGRQAA